MRSKAPNHPLLPGEASTVLNVVTFLFASGGALLMVLLIVGLVGKLLGWSLMASITVNPWAVLLRGSVAAGYLWTAWLLSRRRTLGGILGLAFLALSIVPPLLFGGTLNRGDLLLSVLGAVGLAFSWSYLNDDAPAEQAPSKVGPRAG